MTRHVLGCATCGLLLACSSGTRTQPAEPELVVLPADRDDAAEPEDPVRPTPARAPPAQEHLDWGARRAGSRPRGAPVRPTHERLDDRIDSCPGRSGTFHVGLEAFHPLVPRHSTRSGGFRGTQFT